VANFRCLLLRYSCGKGDRVFVTFYLFLLSRPRAIGKGGKEGTGWTPNLCMYGYMRVVGQGLLLAVVGRCKAERGKSAADNARAADA
jgi:hypothetical protein